MNPMNNDHNGYTLVELIIALSISITVIGWIYSFLASYQKSHNVQVMINEMNQNVRVAMNTITSEIRLAGFKTGSFGSAFRQNISLWVNDFLPTEPYTVNMTDKLVIMDGNTASDMVTFIYADRSPTSLKDQAIKDDINIVIFLSSQLVSKKFAVGNVIYIGNGAEAGPSLEYAIIRQINGQTLDIDTDPGTDLVYEGLKNTYRAGTEVGLMNLVSYAVFDDENDPQNNNHNPGCPILKRRVNNKSMLAIAADIETLKFNQIAPDRLEVTIVGRTSAERSSFRETGYGDYHRRRTLISSVNIRNN